MEALKRKRPGSQAFIFDEESFTVNEVDRLLKSKGLFEEKHIIVLNNIFNKEEGGRYLIKNIKDLKESPHAFILVEDRLKADQKNKLAKESHVFEEFVKSKHIKDDFNTFLLSDALGARDRSRAWILFNRALLAGKDLEEIHRVLFWMVKCMQASKVSVSAKDAGMKPFPYKKARSYSENYETKELCEISRKLINSLQKERMGRVTLKTSIERLILEL